MLILSRKCDERIFIGEIIITLIEIRGDKARIGFEAPADVKIIREEVAQRLGVGAGPVSAEEAAKLEAEHEAAREAERVAERKAQRLAETLAEAVAQAREEAEWAEEADWQRWAEACLATA